MFARENLEKNIQILLISLVMLDITLACWGYFWPKGWFWLFHGVSYVDPQGLLQRSAGNWAAFALFQAIALLR